MRTNIIVCEIIVLPVKIQLALFSLERFFQSSIAHSIFLMFAKSEDPALTKFFLYKKECSRQNVICSKSVALKRLKQSVKISHETPGLLINTGLVTLLLTLKIWLIYFLGFHC